MRTTVITSVTLLLLAVTTTGFGQSTITPPNLQPNQRPTTSPYLFLSDNAQNNSALNYYRQVRPQRDFFNASQRQSRALNTLQRDFLQLQQESLDAERPLIGPTGHTTTFFDSRSYFPGSPALGIRGTR